MEQVEKPFAVSQTRLDTGTGLPAVQTYECDGPWLGEPQVQALIDSMLAATNGIFVVEVYASDCTNDEELFAHLLAGQVGRGRRLKVVGMEWNNAGHFYVYNRPETEIEPPCITNYTG